MDWFLYDMNLRLEKVNNIDFIEHEILRDWNFVFNSINDSSSKLN